jgi:hypothetical protein
MKEKFIELYGADWYNKVNLIMHTGDIIQGADIYEYEAEYFTPFSILSSSVPFMISLGNHDYSTINTFNKYMHYEDFTNIVSENLYSFKLGNVQFVSTNSSNSLYQNIIQTKWLTQTLENSKNNPDVDFIFTFGHEGISEIWPNGNNLFVSKTIFPILAQYPKVAMYSCGHAHNYENGSYITNNSENKDFRTLIFGGAGGTLDRWGDYSNQTDLRDIHKSFDYYGYTIVDIDVANKSYNATAYSLGNPDVVMYNVILDQWHGVKGRLAPDKPIATEVQYPDNYITLIASAFKGYENDSIMSSQFQVATFSGDFKSPLVDTIRHWVDYYGVNKNYEPVNLNNGIDLTRVNIKNNLLNAGKNYKWRVRYRDHNCKWSLWSDSFTFSSLTNDSIAQEKYQINPNPASQKFSINGTDIIKVDLLTVHGKCMKQYNFDNSNNYNLDDIKSGLYLIRIYTSKSKIIRKLIVKKIISST